MAKRSANAYAGFDEFVSPETNERFGSFEVFWHDFDPSEVDEGGDPLPEGWYWWACFPGCLPDGEPIGPFETSKEAWLDAREDF